MVYSLEMLVNRIFNKSMYNIIEDTHRTRVIDLYIYDDDMLHWSYIKNDMYLYESFYKTYLNFDIRYMK
jgi:hypothetical protein